MKLKTKYDRESELVTVSQDTMYDKLSANTNLIVQLFFLQLLLMLIVLFNIN